MDSYLLVVASLRECQSSTEKLGTYVKVCMVKYMTAYVYICMVKYASVYDCLVLSIPTDMCLYVHTMKQFSFSVTSFIGSMQASAGSTN